MDIFGIEDKDEYIAKLESKLRLLECNKDAKIAQLERQLEKAIEIIKANVHNMDCPMDDKIVEEVGCIAETCDACIVESIKKVK